MPDLHNCLVNANVTFGRDFNYSLTYVDRKKKLVTKKMSTISLV